MTAIPSLTGLHGQRHGSGFPDGCAGSVSQAVTRREVLEMDQDGQYGWSPQKVANDFQNVTPSDGFGMVFDTSNPRCPTEIMTKNSDHLCDQPELSAARDPRHQIQLVTRCIQYTIYNVYKQWCK